MRLSRLLPLAALALALTGCTGIQPGWTYAPAPSATPAPSASGSGTASASPSASASASGSVAPSASPSASGSAAPSVSPSASGSTAPSPSGSAEPSESESGATVTITASGIAFTTPAVTGPTTGFTLVFDNEDAGVPHDVVVKDASGTKVFDSGTPFNGIDKRSFQVPALAAGSYPFSCTVHSNMTGTLTIQ